MAEPIIEQIAQYINDLLDGASDPDSTLTLRAVRPKILDWDFCDFAQADVIIVLLLVETVSQTLSDSRTEKATFKMFGIVRELPSDIKADTLMARMAETIRKKLFSGNSAGQACGGLAINIDCPTTMFVLMEGGLVVDVTCEILYMTALMDGYSQAS